jgi:anti-anti-sigma regulatory factor
MRKIKNTKAHELYVLDLAGLALLGDFGAYWLESASTSATRAARWT